MQRNIVLAGPLIILAIAGSYLLGAHRGNSGNAYTGAILSAFEETLGMNATSSDIEIPLDASATISEGTAMEEMIPMVNKKDPPSVSVNVKKKIRKASAKIVEVENNNVQPEEGVTKIHNTATTTAPKANWCDWKTFGLPSGEVLINEIAWMGSEDDPNAEWIELKNVSGRTIELSGFEILSRDKKIKITLNSGTMEPGSFYLLERDSDDAVPDVSADQIYSGALSNSNEWLKLFAPDCRLMDEVYAREKWPAGSASAKKTMERKVAEPAWQTSDVIGGTPRAQNFIPPPALFEGGNATSSFGGHLDTAVSSDSESAASERILIAKVQITGSGTDDDRITLYNPNADSVDVSGWKLRKRTKSGGESSIKVLSGEILGEGYFTWANSKHPDGADATSTQTLSADNSAALFDSNDSIMDAVAWGSGHVSPFIEGSAYPANPDAGQLLMRKFSGDAIADTNNNSEDFAIQ